MGYKNHVILSNQKNTVSESSKQLDIAANRNAEKYSQKELSLRVSWARVSFSSASAQDHALVFDVGYEGALAVRRT